MRLLDELLLPVDGGDHLCNCQQNVMKESGDQKSVRRDLSRKAPG